MNMNIPKFTAEAALSVPTQPYRIGNGFKGESGTVIKAQQFFTETPGDVVSGCYEGCRFLGGGRGICRYICSAEPIISTV